MSILISDDAANANCKCKFCDHGIDEAELTACDRCGCVFCTDCEYSRNDDIPEDWCPDCCEAAPSPVAREEE